MSEAPDTLAERLFATYARCTSYRDEGIVITQFHGPAAMVERRPFSTRFVRPDQFLFEFREHEPNQYAIWLENGAVRSWWSIYQGQEGPATLRLALAGATGVSGGSAYRVPSLLMPDLFGYPHPTLVPVESPAARSQGLAAFELAHRTGPMVQWWVDPVTALLRRVVEPRRPLGPPPLEAIKILRAERPDEAAEVERLFAGSRIEVEETTEYDPAIDVRLVEREPHFEPPRGR